MILCLFSAGVSCWSGVIIAQKRHVNETHGEELRLKKITIKNRGEFTEDCRSRFYLMEIYDMLLLSRRWFWCPCNWGSGVLYIIHIVCMVKQLVLFSRESWCFLGQNCSARFVEWKSKSITITVVNMCEKNTKHNSGICVNSEFNATPRFTNFRV